MLFLFMSVFVVTTFVNANTDYQLCAEQRIGRFLIIPE
jgi:hypothetical protein